MTGEEIRQRLRSRSRLKGHWLAILILTGLLFYTSYFPADPVLETLVIGCSMTLVAISVVLLSPIPWQWTGRNGDSPGPLRGLIQSLLACEAWVFLLVSLDAGLRRLVHAHVAWGPTVVYNLAFTAPVMVMVGYLLASRAQSQEEHFQAMREARDAQTRLLQSQLHPHVLFNAINGLVELVHKDPDAAEQALFALSDLLRRLLQASSRATFQLAEERKLVEHYLHLEKLRLGDRLRVEWEWPGELDHLQLPPLLIQPLAENAIKHGIAPSVEGGCLRLCAELRPERLRLSVLNTGEALIPGLPGGIGLRNLESRLRIAYGTSASFKLQQTGEWTQAILDVPRLEIGEPR